MMLLEVAGLVGIRKVPRVKPGCPAIITKGNLQVNKDSWHVQHQNALQLLESDLFSAGNHDSFVSLITQTESRRDPTGAKNLSAARDLTAKGAIKWSGPRASISLLKL